MPGTSIPISTMRSCGSSISPAVSRGTVLSRGHKTLECCTAPWKPSSCLPQRLYRASQSRNISFNILLAYIGVSASLVLTLSYTACAQWKDQLNIWSCQPTTTIPVVLHKPSCVQAWWQNTFWSVHWLFRILDLPYSQRVRLGQVTPDGLIGLIKSMEQGDSNHIVLCDINIGHFNCIGVAVIDNRAIKILVEVAVFDHSTAL